MRNDAYFQNRMRRQGNNEVRGGCYDCWKGDSAAMKPIVPFEPKRKDAIPEGKQWVYQIKWDGVRILAYGKNSDVELYNRRQRERTHHYPEITETRFMEAESFIVDGEVIALAADGLPSFHEVMRRDGLRRMQRVKEVMRSVPIYYMIFDLIYLNGKWLTDLPLQERQAQLEKVIKPNDQVQLTASETNGAGLFQAVKEREMEGVVCKQLDSTYGIGKKDERWVKVKNYGNVTAVVGGYTLSGATANAVLLGLYDETGRLHFIGKAGTGKLTQNDWRDLTKILGGLTTKECPFAKVHPEMKGALWVKPAITVNVQYSEWRRHEGRVLRQPSIQRFANTPAEECTFQR